MSARPLHRLALHEVSLNSKSRSRIGIADALRGVAVLLVCCSHLTTADSTAALDRLAGAGAVGRTGVVIFFVISGFIIPFSLLRANFQLPRYGQFLLRRIVRLEPPYLVALFLTVGIESANALYSNSRPSFTPSQIGAHIGYLAPYLGYKWINPVFWTLAIEVQFYLIAGIAFRPFIAGTPAKFALWVLVSIALTAFPGVSAHTEFISAWLPIFTLGMLAFRARAGLCGWRVYWPISVLLAGAVLLVHGPVQAVAAFAAASLLACVGSFNAPFLFFVGSISYSLYLVHLPIGARVLNLAVYHGGAPALAGAALALGVSIAVAWILYKIVELPAQTWANKVRYESTLVEPH